MTARVLLAVGRDQVRDGVLSALSAGEALVATGSGTKLDAGNALAKHDVTLRVAPTDEVVHSPDDLVVTVPAGFGFEALQALLAERGQWLPLEGHPGATLGGIVASGAAGKRRLGRGGPRDWLVGLEAILGDGRVVRSGGRVIKNVTGYDLCKLFVGSRGTLGVLTELSFKVLPRPAVARAGTVALADLARVLELRTLAMGFQAAWLELFVGSRIGVEIGFDGDLAAVESQVLMLDGALLAAGFSPATWKEVSTLDLSIPSSDSPVVVRVGTLPSKLVALLEPILGLGGQVVIAAHLGSGLATVGADPADPRGFWHAVRDLAVAAGGHAALERGPKAGEECFAPFRAEWEIGRRIKQVFDPAGILAPGRSPGRF